MSEMFKYATDLRSMSQGRGMFKFEFSRYEQAPQNIVDKVVAAEEMLPLEGYIYAGAMVHGTYYDKTQNPELIITDNTSENVLTIYYLPDGSDGYTEQVESNLRLKKTATLEDDGTYTIQLENYTLNNPITTYIDEEVVKFFVGDRDFSEYDVFIAKIKEMGIDDVLAVQQAAYDRYMNSKGK